METVVFNSRFSIIGFLRITLAAAKRPHSFSQSSSKTVTVTGHDRQLQEDRQ
jgi:hypothetical protein